MDEHFSMSSKNSEEKEQRSEEQKEKWRGELKLRLIDSDFQGLEELAAELEMEIKLLVKESYQGYNKELNWGHLRPMTVISDGKVIALNLSSLKLKEIPQSIHYFKFVRAINLIKNEIMKTNFESLKELMELRELDLSNNKLEQVDLNYLSGHTNLRKLELSYNQLKTVDLKPLEKLAIEEIYLANNQIRAIDLQPLGGMKKIRKARLQSNPLSSEAKQQAWALLDGGLDIWYA
jgi:Leucine-rich repeat (LRR) protein